MAERAPQVVAWAAGASRPPYLAVALVSACALALEVLLLRLFSITQWHHFAYMVISLALLGYGASGTFVTLARRTLLARYRTALTANAAALAFAAICGPAAALALPFNALEIIWDARQWAWLAAIYLLLALPFFFAANCVCLALARYPEAVARLYAADLAGAGAGALAAIGLLWVLSPLGCLLPLAALAVAATLAAAGLPAGRARRAGVAVLALAAVAGLGLALALAGHHIAPNPYKPLSQALSVLGARVVHEASSPLGLVTVVDNRQVPLRHVPGLSLASTVEPPQQLGIYVDGEGPAPLARYEPGRTDLGYLDMVPEALAYHLRPRPRVLVLGAGGGTAILQALHFGARRIDAVELDPQVAALLTEHFAEYSGRIALQPQVRLIVAEARSYVERSRDRYDLIVVPPLDAFGASAAGAQALHESYAYTVEALGRYLDRLAPGGVLAMVRWVKVPPRDGPKLAATAIAALERRGEGDPGARMAWIRSWSTQVLLVKNGALDASDLARVRAFCASRWFDLVWLPGLAREEANRYTLLEAPYFYDAAAALFGPDREAFLQRYKFDLTPPTDARPYYFRFFKWGLLEELAAMPARRGWALVEIGYPVLIATLVQAVVASLVLVLAPLVALRRRPAQYGGGVRSAAVAVYFSCLGFGFMFVEIAFMQRFVLYLGHPLYAAAVVLTGFLVFAGLGAAWVGRRALDSRWRRRPWPAALAVVSAAIVLTVLLSPVHAQTVGLPDALRVLVALALIAPLAFFMGMPFPVGLGLVAVSAPRLVPWAWGINGCTSVTGAVLATLVALHFGNVTLVGVAVALYVVAGVVFRDA